MIYLIAIIWYFIIHGIAYLKAHYSWRCIFNRYYLMLHYSWRYSLQISSLIIASILLFQSLPKNKANQHCLVYSLYCALRSIYSYEPLKHKKQAIWKIHVGKNIHVAPGRQPPRCMVHLCRRPLQDANEHNTECPCLLGIWYLDQKLKENWQWKPLQLSVSMWGTYILNQNYIHLLASQRL